MGKLWSLRGVLGTLVGSIIAAALWDWAAKPGLTILGKAALAFASLGSARIRDDIYREAARDPTSLPATFLLLLVILIGGFGLVAFITEMASSWRRLEKELYGDRVQSQSDALISRRKLRYLRRLTWVVGGVSAVVAGEMLYSVVKLGVEIDVRRQFLTNYAICRPAMTADEGIRIMAMFAATRNYAQYQIVSQALRQIADRGGITSSLWTEE